MTTAPSDTRYLSYARAMGIIAVVFVHVNPGFGWNAGTYHMPLFFFVGGMTLVADRPWNRIGRFVVIDLLGFAVAMTAAYLVISMALRMFGISLMYGDPISLASITTDILVYNAHHVQIAITAWFLVAYASATLFCQLLLRLPRFGRWHAAILGVGLYVAGVKLLAPLYAGRETWYWNLATQVTVGSGFMLVGWAFSRFDWRASIFARLPAFLICLLAYRLLLVHFRPRDIGMVWSEYPAGTTVGGTLALLGIIFTLQLSNLLPQRWKALAYIGDASKHIMAHHLFFFVVVNLAFVITGQMAAASITSVYTKFAHPVMWPLYLAAGVFGSLAVRSLIGLARQPLVRRRMIEA